MLNSGIAHIISLGSYLPVKRLSNLDLEKIVDTSDEWIFTRTGMRERRIASEKETPSDMGAEAARAALAAGGLSPSDIDLLLVATMSPDYPHGTPSTAALLQAKIGAPQAAAVDLQAACSGFVYALATAKAFVESGMSKRVLVVGTEKMSSIVDYTDRTTCVLFGDGAAAAVVSAEQKGLEIESIVLGADGSVSEILKIPAGGSVEPIGQEALEKRRNFLHMNGREVFKHAVRRMEEAVKDCVAAAGCACEDIQWFVPHQANVRIMDALAKKLGIDESKVYRTIQKYGNTSAASIGLTLDELMREHEISIGQRVLLAAAGAGFSWGAVMLKHAGLETKSGEK